MTDDPRLQILADRLRNWFGDSDQKEAQSILAELDAVDPRRRPVSQDRVQAALMRFYPEVGGPILLREKIQRMEAAIAAADRVPASAEPEATPTADGDSARKALISAARQWAGYMDQWTKFQFPTKFGNVFVTLARMAEFPDDFDPVSPDVLREPRRGETWSAAHEAEKPDFPPWSREMWILLHYLAQKCQGQHPAERETMSYLLDQARRATVPETPDAR